MADREGTGLIVVDERAWSSGAHALAHVNGADVHSTDTGAPADRPDAPVVVFGHGLLFNGWMFDHRVEALKDEYRCVTIDWRSQGQWPAARDGHDMDTLTLVSTSWAGRGPLRRAADGRCVGVRSAARHPDRVLALTLLDTASGRENADTVPKYRLFAHVYRVVGPAPLCRLVEPLMFGPTIRSDQHQRAG